MISSHPNTSPEHHRRVVLFDIDGTILNGQGAGRRAVVRAFEERLERSLAELHIELGGNTDLQILRAVLRDLQLAYPSPPERRKLLRRYLGYLEEELEKTPPFLHPGVADLITALEEHDDVEIGLVTGNVQPGAYRKLQPVSLAETFRFGAYGSDREDRNDLVPIALKRLHRITGIRAAGDQVVVIGDTPNDIDCARAAGVRVLAVGTGWGDRDYLQKESDLFLEDLADTAAVVEMILGGSR